MPFVGWMSKAHGCTCLSAADALRSGHPVALQEMPMSLPFMFAAMLAIAAGNAQARDAAQDELAIRRVEAALCKAFEDGDAATLRAGLTADFTLTDSRGAVSGFAQNIDEVERRDPRYDEFRNHGQVVRLYGDAAIVNGITSVRGTSGGEAFAADFRFTDTWVYRDGAWKLAASHATRLSGP
jgi:ketosteroid isomerase-like protein